MSLYIGSLFAENASTKCFHYQHLNKFVSSVQLDVSINKLFAPKISSAGIQGNVIHNPCRDHTQTLNDWQAKSDISNRMETKCLYGIFMLFISFFLSFFLLITK